MPMTFAEQQHYRVRRKNRWDAHKVDLSPEIIELQSEESSLEKAWARAMKSGETDRAAKLRERYEAVVIKLIEIVKLPPRRIEEVWHGSQIHTN